MSIGPHVLELLCEARDRRASDLLLAAGWPPGVYIHAELQPLRTEALSSKDVTLLAGELVPEGLRERLEQDRDVDFSIGHPQLGRCRVNVHYQRNSLAAAIRFVPDQIPTFEELSLPEIVRTFSRYPRGLVLITGGTGSGKSTTLAAIIGEINREMARHIITMEDPIEYAFTNDRSLIEQREIGVDAPSFVGALRHVVRQKPDVIMVGETRDLETIRTAITAAETGHLVLASLHTINAAQTVERIVDVFEPAQQNQIRVQLSGALRAIACQTLLPRADGTGVVPAVEVLIATNAISRAIRDGEQHLIPGMIETGAAMGMVTLDQSILGLLRAGRIRRPDALARAIDPERFVRLMDRDKPAATSTAAVGAAPTRPWE
jgi:twitching motility protein PilT